MIAKHSGAKPTARSQETTFICDCGRFARSACVGEPFYGEYEGKRYCVLHFPGSSKIGSFDAVIERRIKANNFNFRGVWFPNNRSFSGFEFDAEADFSKAFFNKIADFSKAVFNKNSDFISATFKEAVIFSKAKFKAKAFFGNATFSQLADFSGSIFGTKELLKIIIKEKIDFSMPTMSPKVDFKNATFNAKADFSETVFNALPRFSETNFYKEADFHSAKFRTLTDFSHSNFKGEAHFYSVIFDSRADFSATTYESVATFFSTSFGELAYFARAQFGANVIFGGATFKHVANFDTATFGAEAYFSTAHFGANAFWTDSTFIGKASFSSAIFTKKADFSSAFFGSETDFSRATFMDYVRFAGNERRQVFGDQASLDFQYTRVEKPDHFSFHTTTLRPHWFINLDTHKFDFTNVDWDWRSIGISKEIENTNKKQISSPYRLLSISCRHLAVNAEENHRYDEASKFRYWSMDTRRREKSLSLALWKLDWWYWALSGYGERVLRALIALIMIWLSFTLLYTEVGFVQREPISANESDLRTMRLDEVGAPLKFSQAANYSLAVMSLQKPDPKPATPWAQRLVILETILGPVQAALLALAIRRKFMR